LTIFFHRFEKLAIFVHFKCVFKATFSILLLEILGSTKWFHMGANSGFFGIPR